MRVIAVPDGDAPTWVREASVGVEFECLPYEINELHPPHQIVSRQTVIKDFTGAVTVDLQHYISQIEGTSHAAAHWWRGNYDGRELLFLPESFEVTRA